MPLSLLGGAKAKPLADTRPTNAMTAARETNSSVMEAPLKLGRNKAENASRDSAERCARELVPIAIGGRRFQSGGCPRFGLIFSAIF